MEIKRTFKLLFTEEEISKKIREMSRSLGLDLRTYQLAGNSMTLIMKTHKMQEISKSKVLENFISTENQISRVAIELFTQINKCEPIRFLQIKLNNIKRLSELVEADSLPEISMINLQKKETDQSDEDSRSMNALNKVYIEKQIPDDFKQMNKKTYAQPVIEEEDENENDVVEGSNLQGKKGFQTDRTNPSNMQILDPNGNKKFNSQDDVVLQKKKEDNIIGQTFLCPICNEEIDCYSNISKMNNHISQCLDQQESLLDSQNQSSKKNLSEKQNEISETQKRPVQMEISDMEQPKRQYTKRK